MLFNFIEQCSYVNIFLRYFSLQSVYVWSTLISFLILKHHCILGINPTWSCYLFIYWFVGQYFDETFCICTFMSKIVWSFGMRLGWNEGGMKRAFSLCLVFGNFDLMYELTLTCLVELACKAVQNWYFLCGRF